jgi:hypothetical protein
MGVTTTTASAATYVPIATTTLASTATSYTFSSIPSTYTDLVLVCNGAFSGNDFPMIQFNGDTASNYSVLQLSASSTGPHTYHFSAVAWYTADAGGSGTNPWNLIINLNNYSNTTTYKSGLSRYNNTANQTVATSGLWKNTAAINAIKVLTANGTNLAVGTMLSLYGILGA